MNIVNDFAKRTAQEKPNQKINNRVKVICPNCNNHLDYIDDANRYFREDITGWSCPECSYLIEEEENPKIVRE